MSESQPPSREWTGGACALVAIGLLFLVPSGLCTGTFGFMAIVEAIQSKDFSDLSSLTGVLMVGLPFIVLGALLIRFGLRRRKLK